LSLIIPDATKGWLRQDAASRGVDIQASRISRTLDSFDAMTTIRARYEGTRRRLHGGPSPSLITMALKFIKGTVFLPRESCPGLATVLSLVFLRFIGFLSFELPLLEFGPGSQDVQALIPLIFSYFHSILNCLLPPGSSRS
jgi:hypothetical protein